MTDSPATDSPATEPRFTREELAAAFADFQAVTATAAATGDWNPWVDQFTEDAEYIEHAFGTFRGREEIRPWALKTMGSFPGNHMTEFPARWITIDEVRGEVIAEIDNPMRDPGDGSVFGAANLSIFRYAGDGQWRGEEDWYNPMKFGAMAMGWCKKAIELGTITEEAQRWYDKTSKMMGGQR